MRLVIVESPYAGKTEFEIARNVVYARACMRDCLMRGEAPFASHLLYTQPGILDDNNPEERALGIKVGFEWGKRADATVVYVNLGVTEGMQWGIESAKAKNRPVEERCLSSVIMKNLDAELGMEKRKVIEYPLINSDVRFQSMLKVFESNYGVIERIVEESYERGLDHRPEFEKFKLSLENLCKVMKGD